MLFSREKQYVVLSKQINLRNNHTKRKTQTVKLQVSFVEYRLFCRALWQKRPIRRKTWGKNDVLLLKPTKLLQFTVAECCNALQCVAVCCRQSRGVLQSY